MTHNELVLLTRKTAEAINSWKCFCGRRKVRKLPLCRRCYYELPDDLKSNLSDSLPGGFESGLLQAYLAAKAWHLAAEARNIEGPNGEETE